MKEIGIKSEYTIYNPPGIEILWKKELDYLENRLRQQPDGPYANDFRRRVGKLKEKLRIVK